MSLLSTAYNESTSARMNKTVPPNEHGQHLQRITLVQVSMLASYKNTAQNKLTGERFSYSLSALALQIHTVLVQAVNSETLTKCLRLVLFKALFILDLCGCVRVAAAERELG